MNLQRFNYQIHGIYLFDLLSLLARVGLGIVFLLAAWAKIPDISAFQQNVANYHMMPAFLLPIFSFIVPWVELITGLYLVFGIYLKYTNYVAILLLVMFMIAITYAIITKQPVTVCGCFAESGGGTIGWIDIIRDIGFLALSGIIFLTNSNFLSIDLVLFKKKTT
jgi:uncharacterized membrane protein YphA (DoxX/SURF4 family)